MFYKYNAFSHRLQPSGAIQAYKPEGLMKAAVSKEPSIEHSGAGRGYNIITMMVERPNKTPLFQRIMQVNNSQVVHLMRGQRDKIIYRGLLGFGFLAFGLGIANIGLVAVNKKKRMSKS